MKILELIFPPKCVGCEDILRYDITHSPFCEICSAKWEQEKSQTLFGAGGTAVREVDGLQGDCAQKRYVMYLVSYKPNCRLDIVDSFIMKLKDSANRRSVDFAALELSEMISREAPIVCEGGAKHENAVIAWIPRSRKAIREVGFDHMALVARSLSEKLGVPAMNLLRRSYFSREQKQLGASARSINAKRTIKLKKSVCVRGKTVVLIDDIVTTGSSIAAATDLFLESGAEQVINAVLAASEREENVKKHIGDNFNIIKKRKSKDR